MSTSLPQGTRFDKYEIRSPLGKGGMGEVYLATDTKLGRTVALKILSADVTKNSDHLRRFMQEARTTSSLNHPNILTVHDIGHSGATHYIAAEFVDGITLRQRLRGRPMKLGEVIDVLMQVCLALAAAHEAGIVHRDIKPENVMLRPDGYVKVLDFGLAKLVESEPVRFTSPEATTQLNIYTDPHAIVGTVDYMSPEQLRSQTVDARTDMWSVGVMLYEMVAGCRPFSGQSKSDTIALILGAAPAPLVQFSENIPTELQMVVTKLLREEKDGRYQTAKELWADLSHLKQTLDSEEQLARTALSTSRGLAGTGTSGKSGKATAGNATAPAETNEIGTARRTSGVEDVPPVWKRWKTVTLIVLSALVLGLAGILYWRPKPTVENRERQPSDQQMKFTRLRSNGNVLSAAISPDGKYVATIVDEKGSQGIWIRQITAATNIPLLPAAQTEYKGLTFSPGSDYVYFQRVENESSVLYQTPVLGGLPPRKILDDVPTSVTFSPDGKRLAFVRSYPQEGVTALMIANADGTGERRVATRGRPEFFDTGGPQLTTGPAWSPDGKLIACPTLNLTEPVHMNLVEVRVDDGAMKQINKDPWILIGRVSWTADGNALVFNAFDNATSPSQIWRMTYADGVAKRITNDQNSYTAVSLTGDSETAVAVYLDQASNLWFASNRGFGEAVASSAANASEVVSVAWTPDGKLVYSSNVGDNSTLWVMDADGKNQKQLTFEDKGDGDPTISPTNGDIVFVSSRTGSSHLWRMTSDGGNPIQVTRGEFEDQPCFSADGKWVLYRRFTSTGSSIWKLPVNGGDTQQVTERIAQQPAVSPDGKDIAFYYRNADVNSPWKLMVIPFADGKSSREFDLHANVNPSRPGIRWRSDGRALTYVATVDGVSNVWEQLLDGGEPRQITHFKEEKIFSFAWSPDGQRLACVRGNEKKSAVIIKGFN